MTRMISGQHVSSFLQHNISTCYTHPQKVWGRFHTNDEQYINSPHEIIPIKEKKGQRTYVMMQPYVLEPKLTLTIGLYDKPKHFADQNSAIGKTIGTPQHQGFREAQVGNAQAWCYHQDKTIVLWEGFFESRFRKQPLIDGPNMRQLWRGCEHWLIKQFPNAITLATPFNDPVAESIDEYQAFLKLLGYSPIAQAAFGKLL